MPFSSIFVKRVHPQLPLDFVLESSQSFNTYWTGESALALNVVSAFAEGRGEDRQVYLWGPPHSGKTHLLSAACHSGVQTGLRIAYLPAAMIATIDSLSGYDAFDLVCIDDLHLLPRRHASEVALFNLINELRVRHGRLLFAANCLQSDLGVTLPDLYTRLCWGASFALNSISPDQLPEFLAFRAQQLGFTISDDVLAYLLNHYSRDLNSMLDRLRDLDRASIQTKRRITIPFVREVLGT